MHHRVLLVLLVLGQAGCDSTGPDDGEALRVSEFAPAANEPFAPAGTAVTITFANDAEPGSLASSVIMVTGEDTLVVNQVYDAGSRTLTVSAPLLPATSYRVKLDTTARARGGLSIETPVEWSFTTAPWHTGIVGDVALFSEGDWGGPALASGHDGRRHLAFASSGELHYATCLSACGQSAAWSVVGLGVTGRAGFEPTIAADAGGRLHLLHGSYGTHGGALLYSTCPAGCEVPANWSTVWLSQAGEIIGPSLAMDPGGALHTVFHHIENGELVYGHCMADCLEEASWNFETVVQATVGLEATLALGANGRLHVAYLDFTAQHLAYATCTADCSSAANWSTAAVDPASGAGRAPSIAIGSDGTLQIAYYDETARDLRVSTCRQDCTTSQGWLTAIVEADGDVGRSPSLQVDAQGRAHVAYYDFQQGALHYATCSRSCESAGAWRIAEADDAGDVGRSPSLSLTDDSRIAIAYLDYTTGDPYPLKVLE